MPSLGIKVDACPGRLNQFPLYIKRCGYFYGQCSELCGILHGFMPISIYVIDCRHFEPLFGFEKVIDLMISLEAED